MNRLVPVIFVILLVSGMGIFNIYEYSRNQQLTAENTQLKNRLSKQALQLSLQELRLSDQGWQLSQTQARVVELEKRLNAQEQEIQTLREQLKRASYITVGLTLLWAPNASVNIHEIEHVVQRMNDAIWDRFQVYYFIYHAEPQAFMPLTTDHYCQGAWIDRALKLYSVRDIPVGIFSDLGKGKIGEIAGCEVNHVIALDANYVNEHVLSHELLHVLGFSEKELSKMTGFDYTNIIPIAWFARIQTNARRFQIILTT
ncbi:MAG: hypothetical protein WCC94_03125 [Candidatus Bathyarchaeia archaeon]